MVNSFDYSTGARAPSAACFQMNDVEFSVVLRGWKHPPPLGEEIVRSSGINPFTKELQVFARRVRVREVEPPDSDAVRNPQVWHLPWIDMSAVHGEQIDLLAMVLLNWSREYAGGEVSQAYVNGPENVNDWFLLFPLRVVAAMAVVTDEQIPVLAARWSAAAAKLGSEEGEMVLRRLVPFARAAQASARRVVRRDEHVIGDGPRGGEDRLG